MISDSENPDSAPVITKILFDLTKLTSKMSFASTSNTYFVELGSSFFIASPSDDTKLVIGKKFVPHCLHAEIITSPDLL